MIAANLQQWMQHPEMLDRDTLYELRNVVARYPYFQTARLLYLKNLFILHDINLGEELRKSVLYIADRRQLFHLIEGEKYAFSSEAQVIGETLENEELSVDRTLSLIDAFLSTVPEEASLQPGLPAGLDYSIDYTSYLMQEPAAPEVASQEVPKLKGQDLIDDFIEKSETTHPLNKSVILEDVKLEDAKSEEAKPEEAKLEAEHLEAEQATKGAKEELVPEIATSLPAAETATEMSVAEKEAEKEAEPEVEAVVEPVAPSVPENTSVYVAEEEDDSCFTETLAKIYVKQQRYSKALEIIKKLSLKYPKKNAYFADQIRFLEKLIINANSK